MSEVKVGLALGGGGARGFAHLGVIKALRELEVPIHCVAGTSIGAIAGGVLAAGTLDRALEWAAEPNWKKLPKLFLDPHLSLKALFGGRRIEKLLRQMVPAATFEELSLPFAAVATDLMSGEEVAMRRGDVQSAMRASMAVPGLFCPVARDGRVLVDGGMVNPVPVSVCRQLGADKVIAVDLNRRGRDEPARDYGDLNVFSVIDETCKVVMKVASSRACPYDAPDLLLAPPVGNVKMFDFHKAAELVATGYDYALTEEWDRLHGFAEFPAKKWV